MRVDFDQIDSDSRIWIYQINRALSKEESDNLIEDTFAFLTQWSSHGDGLKASAKIVNGRLLIIAADEKHSGASGCSIDSKVAFLREVQLKMGIDLFSRENIFYIDNGELNTMDLNDFKRLVGNGDISLDTPIYNTTIHKKSQLEDSFLIPVKDSWMMRMLTFS